MKKIVSAMGLCVVLFGAVMMATGCGSKPAKGSVWKVEKITEAGVSQSVTDDMYFCFHSNGNAYSARKELGSLTAEKLGTYTINKKTIAIKLDSVEVSFTYTLKGEKMTLKGTLEGVTEEVEMQKVSSPTEEEIKKAVH